MIESQRDLIFLLDMLQNYKNFFHVRHYFFFSHRHIYKVENKNKKQTKNVGLMEGEFVQIVKSTKTTKIIRFFNQNKNKGMANSKSRS
jgi:hypothetical protein